MSTQQSPNPIFGLLRLAVVVAAGVGGWFAYDTYLVEDAEAAAAPTDAVVAPAVPWPSDLVVADAPLGGTVRQTRIVETENRMIYQIDIDNERSRARAELFSGEGVLSVVETDGVAVWVDDGAGAGWVLPGAAGENTAAGLPAENLLARIYSNSHPVLTDFLQPQTWPYTVLNSDSRLANGNRLLSFRIKGAAFADAEPARAAQWRANSSTPNSLGPVDMEIEMDAAGNIVSWTDPSIPAYGVFRWEQLPTPPVYLSPIGI